MDEYDEFDLEDGAHFFLLGLLGVVIASTLALIFSFTFSYEATNKFFEVISQIIALGITLHPALVFILNLTLTNLVSPVAYIWAQSPEFVGVDLAGVNLNAGLISSLISFMVAGLVIGILTKKDWLTGLQAGVVIVAFMYAVSFGLMIISLLIAQALFAGLATVITLGLYISLTFVMSIISFINCAFWGAIGGYIYQRFLKNRYAY
ncbi:MAG: hypothetical protein ACTSX4_03145 [Candidatus Helarchaeota archaeon]